MQQAGDFRDEARALAQIVRPLGAGELAQPTLFKGWTIEEVIGHLHMFDTAALLTLRDPAAFAEFLAPVAAGMARGESLRTLQVPWLGGLAGRALVARWIETAEEVAEAYDGTDPKARLKWAGPDMSALSCITARQMETWAHGQEVFDALGLERAEADRIRNICHLGVATHGWSFAVRGQVVPDPAAFVRLIAPSGAEWTWGDPASPDRVEGSAVAFAQVVTQVRNIADTGLSVTGDGARRWMQNAQCFAGPPETPPPPGSRHRARRA